MAPAPEVGRRMRICWKVSLWIGRCLGYSVVSALPAQAASYYVTVAGLGGEPDYEQRFTALAKDLDKLLKTSGGDAHVYTLTGSDATKAHLTDAMNQVAHEAKADDAFTLILIGHGSYDSVEYKFNLPGPDISGEELEALCDASADVDKNEVISALEAFQYADRKTASFYESQKRLATEHAIIEDTGKKEGVRAPSAENGEGLLASNFLLLRLGAAQKAANDPAKRALLEKKEELERKIDTLKYQKAAMSAEDYKTQLSSALVDLARVQQELDK